MGEQEPRVGLSLGTNPSWISTTALPIGWLALDSPVPVHETVPSPERGSREESMFALFGTVLHSLSGGSSLLIHPLFCIWNLIRSLPRP